MKRRFLYLWLLAALLGGCVAGQPLFGQGTATTVAVTPGAATAAGVAIASATAVPPAATAVPPAAMPGATAAAATGVATASAATVATVQATAPVSGTTGGTTAEGHAWQPDERLPIDPQVRTGVLPNGLTYMVRKNSQPGNRAELRLVVNAGSVMEADDQKGLAHFLEHMLFNGTCRFPKQSIKDFLESNGMRFGADLNASTSFDETIYYLRIPLDDPKVLDTGLNVLVDWASCATLDPTELNRERGVIVEENRLRELNAQGRIQDQMIEGLLAGSQYAQRLPIGDMNIIRNTPVDALKRFYQDWYRPDLMSVVAVGDFDATQVEQMVRQKFGSIPARQDAPKRPTFTVPDFKGTHYLVAADPENPLSGVQVYAKEPPRAYGTVALYRQSLVRALFYRILQLRYNSLIQAGTAPFASAGVGRDDLVRTQAASIIQAQTQVTQTLPALESLMTEVERVRQYGFTQPELDRVKSTLLEAYRRAYDNRNTTDTSALVEEYTRHVLAGEDVPGIAVENELARQLVPQITLEEVNQQVQGLAAPDDRLVLAIEPQGKGLTPPTEQQLAGVVNGVAGKQLQPYVAEAGAQQLMAEIPQPAAVISQTTMADLGVTELRLANGVRVLLKPTTFKTDEVRFTGIARGGSSLVPDADVVAARLAPAMVARSGAGKFSQAQLDEFLAGKSVSVTPSIRELSQRFDGTAAPRDLETALQLIYLYVTQPKIDPNAVKAVKDQAAADLANRQLAPEADLQDALTMLQYGNSLRYNPVMPLEAVRAVDPQRALQIYKDRFGDMSGSTFVLVGNFDVAQATQLAQRYLGNLPGKGGEKQWRNTLPPLPTGVQQKEIHKGNEDRATAVLLFPGAFPASPDDQTRLQIIQDILNIRLLAELRQKLSATYSPSVSARTDFFPEHRYALTVNFTADPARTPELLQATFGQIEDLRTKGPSAQELAIGKEQEVRKHEGELEQNQYWQTLLTNYALDPALDPRSALDANARIGRVSAADIQAAAQQVLDMGRYIQVVLYPAQPQPGGTVTVLAH